MAELMHMCIHISKANSVWAASVQKYTVKVRRYVAEVSVTVYTQKTHKHTEPQYTNTLQWACVCYAHPQIK